MWCINGDIDSRVSKFYEQLNLALASSVPMAKPLVDQGPAWFTPTLRRLRNIKNRLFKNFKKSNTAVNYSKYSMARNRYNSENSTCYTQHLAQMRHNTKNFFKFVNSKRRAQKFPSSMKLGSKKSSDNLEIANLFADFFQSSYTQGISIGPCEIHTTSLNHFPCIILTEDEVLNGLKTLRSSFSPGPDGVPTYILKSCARELYLPLTKIFNYLFEIRLFSKLLEIKFCYPTS